MNRKAIIACIAALAALAVLVAAAVFFLYSGTEETKTSAFASEGSTGLLAAVPSDAVMVAGFSDMKSACSLLTDTSGCFHYFTGGKESSLLLKFLEKAEGTDHGVLKSSRAVLSLHYNGSLVPLLVIDAGRAGSLADGKAAGLIALADSAGLSVLLPDCPETADENTYLHRRDIILLSTSDVQTKSAERHIAKGISVLDSEGFADCLRQAGEVGNTVFLSCGEAGKFFAGIARKGLSGYADFLKKFAGWASFSIDDAASDHLRLSGRFTSDSGAEDFINVFRGYSPARSSVGTVLPSYTVFFASLPLDDVSSYITCADAFADGTGKLGKTELARKQLQKRSGLSPVQWARTLDVKEVAAAFFKVGGRIIVRLSICRICIFGIRPVLFIAGRIEFYIYRRLDNSRKPFCRFRVCRRQGTGKHACRICGRCFNTARLHDGQQIFRFLSVRFGRCRCPAGCFYRILRPDFGRCIGGIFLCSCYILYFRGQGRQCHSFGGDIPGVFHENQSTGI